MKKIAIFLFIVILSAFTIFALKIGAEKYILRKISSESEKRNFDAEIGNVEISWNGNLNIERLVLKRPGLEIRASAAVSPINAPKHPEKFVLRFESLDVVVDAKAAKARRSSESPKEKSVIPKRSLPFFIIRADRFSFTLLSEDKTENRVAGKQLLLNIEDDGDKISVDADARLSQAAYGNYRFSQSTRFWGIKASLRRDGDTDLATAFYPPMDVEIQRNENLRLRLAFSALTLRSNLDYQNTESTLRIYAARVSSENFAFLRNMRVGSLHLGFAFDAGKINAKNIALFAPSAQIDVVALAQSPIFEKYLAKFDLDGTIRTLKGNTDVQNVKKKKEEKKTFNIPAYTKRIEKPLFMLRDVIVRLRDEIRNLPQILIEGADIRLIGEGKAIRLPGLGFNSSALGRENGNNDAIELSAKVGEAAFGLSLSFPDNKAKAHLSFRNLDARTFFALAQTRSVKDFTGNLDADVSLDLSNDTHYAFSLRASTRDFGFLYPRLGPQPLRNLDVSLEIDAKYDIAKDTLDARRMRFKSGPAEIFVDAELKKLKYDPYFTFKIYAENLSCEAVEKAIPKALLPGIDNLRLRGENASPELLLRWPHNNPIELKLDEKGFIDSPFCTAIDVRPHHVEKLLDNDYVHTVTDYTSLKQGIDVGPGTPSYIPIDRIPPYVVAAMFLTEDKRFFDHGVLRSGFIARAMRLNLRSGRYVYGGSTVSQQLVKNLFLSRHKNLARKLEEFFVAQKVESVVPKKRLMELYINMIEFGPDIYGIENAARYYFSKSARALTPLEGAYLASLKVSPSKGGKFALNASKRCADCTDCETCMLSVYGAWWLKRYKYILKTLAETGYITPADTLSAYPWIPVFALPES